MANMCQEFHCLPRSGGLHDQDFLDALKLQWVLSAQEKARKEQQKKKKK